QHCWLNQGNARFCLNSTSTNPGSLNVLWLATMKLALLPTLVVAVALKTLFRKPILTICFVFMRAQYHQIPLTLCFLKNSVKSFTEPNRNLIMSSLTHPRQDCYRILFTSYNLSMPVYLYQT